jgi:hypothetical protein
MICGAYHFGFDLAFWFVSTLVPFIIGIICATYCQTSYFLEYNDAISVTIILLNIFLGVGLRYYVVETFTQFVQPTLIMAVLIGYSFYTMRVRFIYTLVSTSIISFLWIAINIPWINVNVFVHHTGRSFYIGAVCTIVIGLVASFATYETEYFYRMQFLMSKEMKKNNAKLTNQLKLLAKTYNKKAGSLDSPLERSVMVIRSVMADPILSSQHLMALGQVLALLSSSNLLTPDLEGNLGESLDNQQQAWLFSEIAARKRGGGRTKAKSRRRNSGNNSNMDSTAKMDIVSESNVGDESMFETTGSVMSHSVVQQAAPVSTQLVPARRNSDDPGAAYPPILPEVAPLLLKCGDYNWQIFDFSKATSNHSLTVLSHHLFTNANLFEAFSIPRDKFRNFLLAVEKGYHSNLPCTNYVT